MSDAYDSCSQVNSAVMVCGRFPCKGGAATAAAP